MSRFFDLRAKVTEVKKLDLRRFPDFPDGIRTRCQSPPPPIAIRLLHSRLLLTHDRRGCADTRARQPPYHHLQSGFVCGRMVRQSGRRGGAARSSGSLLRPGVPPGGSRGWGLVGACVRAAPAACCVAWALSSVSPSEHGGPWI